MVPLYRCDLLVGSRPTHWHETSTIGIFMRLDVTGVGILGINKDESVLPIAPWREEFL